MSSGSFRCPPTPLGLSQLLSHRCLTTSIVITPTAGSVPGVRSSATPPWPPAATLDRRLHRAVVTNLDGESYRLRDHQAAAETLRRITAGNRQQRH
jgi:hypothetical protein